MFKERGAKCVCYKLQIEDEVDWISLRKGASFSLVRERTRRQRIDRSKSDGHASKAVSCDRRTISGRVARGRVTKAIAAVKPRVHQKKLAWQCLLRAALPFRGPCNFDKGEKKAGKQRERERETVHTQRQTSRYVSSFLERVGSISHSTGCGN